MSLIIPQTPPTSVSNLPTRAAFAALRVPSAAVSVQTGGYTTAGDGGGATYARATGPFSDGSSFQSADGAWWQLSMPVVNVAMFGAVGGVGYGPTNYSSLPDDTTAIQNAINFAQANCFGALQVGPRQYRFTKSLNCTKANPFTGYTLLLSGMGRSSQLVPDLSEAYPALDFTNANRGVLSSLFIQGTVSSLHTCTLYFAETTNSGMNLFTARDVIVNDYGSSSKMAVFGYSADQFNFDNCAVYGGGAANLYGTYFGLLNPGSITSKYYTSPVSTGADATLFLANNTQFMCGTGPALFVDGFDQVTGTGNYLNAFTVYNQNGVGHTQGMMRVRSTPPSFGQRFTTIKWLGCRFEDQGANHLPGSPTVVCTGSIAPNADGMTSTLTVTATSTGAIAVGNVLVGTGVATATTIIANVSANVWTVTNNQTVASTTISSYYISSPSVYVVDYVYESEFNGWYNTAGAGIFGGTGSHINSTVTVGNNGSGSAFNGAGALVGGSYHFSGGANNLGLFDQTNSRGYQMGGRIGATEAAVYSAIGTTVARIPDLNIDGNNAWQPRQTADTRVFFPTSVTPVNYGLGWRGPSGIVNTSAYTGGSGLQTVISSQLFSLTPLYWNGVSTAELSQPFATFTMTGGFVAAWAASGEMKFQAQQTVSGTTYTATLIDVTGIPAYGASSAWKLTVDLYYVSGAGLLAYVWFETAGTSPLRQFNFINLTSANFNAQTGGLVTVIMAILNSGSVSSSGVAYKLSAS